MKVNRFVIATRDFGNIKVLRPIPRQSQVAEDGSWFKDPWGELAPLRDGPWASLIPVVDGEVFSHALHGHARPLMGVIGPKPRAILRMLPEGTRRCRMEGSCISYSVKTCFPGKNLPPCIEVSGVGDDALMASAAVLLAWSEGRYVVIVEGDEFSL